MSARKTPPLDPFIAGMRGMDVPAPEAKAEGPMKVPLTAEDAYFWKREAEHLRRALRDVERTTLDVGLRADAARALSLSDKRRSRHARESKGGGK